MQGDGLPTRIDDDDEATTRFQPQTDHFFHFSVAVTRRDDLDGQIRHARKLPLIAGADGLDPIASDEGDIWREYRVGVVGQ